MIRLDVVLYKVNRTILNDPSLNRTEALARSVLRIRDAVKRIEGLSEELEFADIGHWGTLHELYITSVVTFLCSEAEIGSTLNLNELVVPYSDPFASVPVAWEVNDDELSSRKQSTLL
uniref:Uncharacterized protein n=1 Tax=Steinernema glaseri TaxID=37863 RepID=A0A1I8A6I6_9BILA